MADLITIGVYGGCVQWITRIPSGIEVRVNDYDIDGQDDDNLSTDEEGHRCMVTIYGGK